MIASLPMYERPETAEATDRFWGLIRDELRSTGIDAPERLERNSNPMQDWTDRRLLLSQTCGMPYRTLLADMVDLVGTPDLGLDDCAPGYYFSVLVATEKDQRTHFDSFARSCLAYNDQLSQSGWAAPVTEASARGFEFGSFLETGSHLASARAVAKERADIAAIDAHSWRMIGQFESWATNLKVVGYTSPTPALPLITGQRNLVEKLFLAVEYASGQLGRDDRNLLPYKALVSIPKSEYLSILVPSESLAKVGGN